MKRLSRLISVPLALLFAIVFAAGCGMSEEEARQKLADLNVEYSEETFVEHAAEGDQTVVDLFLKAGMNPDAQGQAELPVEDLWGDWKTDWEVFEEAKQYLVSETEGAVEWEQATPLALAAMKGQAEAVRRLLEAGADPNAEATLALPRYVSGDISGITPMHWAAFSGEADVVSALLEAGADPRAGAQVPKFGGMSGPGFTPLMIAGTRGNAEAARTLLEAGVEPQMDGEGRMPMAPSLYCALRPVSEDQGYREERVETIRVLLEAGALKAGSISEDEDPSGGPYGVDKNAPGVQEVMRLMREASARG